MTHLTVRGARDLLGLTQQQLADRAGVKRSAIDDIETGRSQDPRYQTVMRIVRALQQSGLNGVSAEDIFPVSETSSAPPAAPDSDDVAAVRP